MNFADTLAIAEAVLLAAGLEPPRARHLARSIALAQRAHLDGTPIGAIKADPCRYAGLVPPPDPEADRDTLPPDTLPTGRVKP